MNERALVSVIMPAYNAERTIAEAIESVLKQSYRPIEVLVGDDGSADSTVEVVKGFGPPVRCLCQENKGPAGARNLALRHARGQYLAFLDADDLWHPEKLAIQVGFMERNPHIGLCGTDKEPFRIASEVRWKPVDVEIDHYEIAGRAVIIKNRFDTSSAIARAEALQEAGEFDEDIFGTADWDMWRRITHKWSGLHLACALTGYRELEESVNSNARRMLENSRKVLRKSFADNPDLPWHVRQRAVSYLHFDAALESRNSSHLAAAVELAKSLLLWPFPIGAGCHRPFARVKVAICLCIK